MWGLGRTIGGADIALHSSKWLIQPVRDMDGDVIKTGVAIVLVKTTAPHVMLIIVGTHDFYLGSFLAESKVTNKQANGKIFLKVFFIFRGKTAKAQREERMENRETQRMKIFQEKLEKSCLNICIFENYFVPL
jgi:hypothetical protein